MPSKLENIISVTILLWIALLFEISKTSYAWELPKIKPSPYPVSVRSHAALESTNPLDPSSYTGLIPVSISHSIYAANLVAKKRLFIPSANFNPKTLFSFIVKESSAQKLNSKILPILENEEFPEGLVIKEYKSLAKKIGFQFQLRTVLAADRLSQQVNACSIYGSSKNCCIALLSPWVFARGKGLPSTDSLEPNLVTTRAWLSVCGPVISDFPKDLIDFKSKYGHYDSSPEWTRELHPQSMAKQGGRRVFRRYEGKSKNHVSVAETLDRSCGITETEVVLTEPSGLVKFFSYKDDGKLSPFGMFPMAGGRKSIRVTPESCLGCHYTFDTREFTVPIPSYRALHLRLSDSATNEIHCKSQKDQLIWHTF